MPTEQRNRKNFTIEQRQEIQTDSVQQVEGIRAHIFLLETHQIGTSVQNRKHQNQNYF